MLAVYDVCKIGKTDDKYLKIMSSVPNAEKYDLFTVDNVLFVPLDQVYDLMKVQPDPDTVSRQAVLDAMASASQKAWDTLAVDDVRIVILSDAENAIKALTPSPSRPHGQWIPCTKNGLPLSEMAYRDGQKWYGYKCSNCTFIYKGNALTESPYCQNCGADMRQNGGAV